MASARKHTWTYDDHIKQPIIQEVWNSLEDDTKVSYGRRGVTSVSWRLSTDSANEKLNQYTYHSAKSLKRKVGEKNYCDYWKSLKT